MKKIIAILTFAAIYIAAPAQVYSVRPGFYSRHPRSVSAPADSLPQYHLWRAGKKLRAVSSFDCAYISCTMLAGACYLSGINSDARKTLNTIGTVFAVASVVSRIALIVVRSEAGRELQLSTTGITYKF